MSEKMVGTEVSVSPFLPGLKTRGFHAKGAFYVNWKLSIFLLLYAIAAVPSRAIAHGVKIESQQTPAIKIHAIYDSGTPMTNAQVSVYTPDDPQNPWITGTTDDKGQFLFIPDHNTSGLWEVIVRKAGHGALIAVPVSPPGQEISDSASVNAVTSSPNSNPIQKWVAVAAVIWGFIGTALFFSRLKPPETATAEPTLETKTQESDH